MVASADLFQSDSEVDLDTTPEEIFMSNGLSIKANSTKICKSHTVKKFEYLREKMVKYFFELTESDNIPEASWDYIFFSAQIIHYENQRINQGHGKKKKEFFKEVVEYRRNELYGKDINPPIQN